MIIAKEAQVWRVAQAPDQALVDELSSELRAHPVLSYLLVSRGVHGVEEARRLLEPDLAHLPDPFLMADMEQAVDRLLHALEKRETIAVFGDYDVDGVSSTAILTSFLQECGASVLPYVPRRLSEGYGLNLAAVDSLVSSGASLIVACDCGITSVEEVRLAARRGCDVIVVDHHRVPEELPVARAILNPCRTDCSYPFGDLAAVGVTFKLLMALRRRLREKGRFSSARQREPNLRELMDIVAMGTVCDVVPLVDENRVLVAHGLRVLAEDRRVGLRALKSLAKVASGNVTAGQVGFHLGPRINAAGRLADASIGLNLLLCTDPFKAANLAMALDEANSKRQAIEQAILTEALALAREVDPRERGLVLVGEGWHPGVVGIVASRVAERFRRPTLVLGQEGDSLRGSGRTAGSFHLYEALSACSSKLQRFGGHRAAAGLELLASDLPSFRQAFLERCGERVRDEDLVPMLSADLELPVTGVDDELLLAVEKLGPFGVGNPAPVFVARGVRLDGCRVVGRPAADGTRHLKSTIDGLEAIGFGLGRPSDPSVVRCADIAYTVGFNEWQGERRPQIVLKALLPKGEARIVTDLRSAA